MSDGSKLVAGRYRLTSQIGSGGMGRVWLARDEVLRRDVAVKEVVLPDELSVADRNDLCWRTLREARAAGRLNHPNVVAVYDVIQADARPWIVMELVRSRSLYEVIKSDGPVSPKRAAEIGLCLLAALRAAHNAGVWHRDVKPGNVLLADDGRVVLTDFGLATFDGDGTVTRAGLVLGSAQYIAPERARDGVSGPESDMWSLGATLYAAVEGRSPFARDTSMATLTALATAPPDTPRRAGQLREVLVGLLRKNPRHRMGADEAEKLLRRVANGEVTGHTRLPRQRQAQDARSEVRLPGGPASTPDAGPAESAHAPSGGDSGGRNRLGPHTITEETFRHTLGRWWRWPWVVGVLGLALAVPSVVLLVDSQDRLAGATGPTPSASAALRLTSTMGVQACIVRPPEEGEQLSAGEKSMPGAMDLIDGWVYHRDPAGFYIGVPRDWRLSRIGALLCLRDPSSLKAIAVVEVGTVPGHPRDLLDQGEEVWRQAADLANYERLGISDILIEQGGADLEYTYDASNGVPMHGVTRMVRMDGRVFAIFWLCTHTTWPADRVLMNKVQPSFGLEP